MVVPATQDGLTPSTFPEIVNDDPPPGVLVGFLNQGGSLVEGDSGVTVTQIPLGLSGASGSEVTVSYEIQAVNLSNPATPGVDFVVESGTVVFSPGQTEASIPVTVFGDTEYEAYERIRIDITGATGAVVVPATQDGLTPSTFPQIVNDDPPSLPV